jgi:hypothetical protein
LGGQTHKDDSMKLKESGALEGPELDENPDILGSSEKYR